MNEPLLTGRISSEERLAPDRFDEPLVPFFKRFRGSVIGAVLVALYLVTLGVSAAEYHSWAFYEHIIKPAFANESYEDRWISTLLLLIGVMVIEAAIILVVWDRRINKARTQWLTEGKSIGIKEGERLGLEEGTRAGLEQGTTIGEEQERNRWQNLNRFDAAAKRLSSKFEHDN